MLVFHHMAPPTKAEVYSDFEIRMSNALRNVSENNPVPPELLQLITMMKNRSYELLTIRGADKIETFLLQTDEPSDTSTYNFVKVGAWIGYFTAVAASASMDYIYGTLTTPWVASAGAAGLFPLQRISNNAIREQEFINRLYEWQHANVGGKHFAYIYNNRRHGKVVIVYTAHPKDPILDVVILAKPDLF